jgi:hypothetical protein
VAVPQPVARGFEIVGDDPTVLARCEVAPPAPGQAAAWAIGDDELQAELRALGRPAGLVRVRDRVLVSAAAVDPFPRLDGGPSP